MAHSPASSPRLPSPPPMAEDQIGPTSPGVSLYDDEHGKLSSHSHHNAKIDANASRRIRPGTKSEDMASGPPLVDLGDIDSAFQLTEHVQALHHAYTHPADGTLKPVDVGMARELSRPPQHTSREIWLYELARFLIQRTNAIIVGLFADSPPCSAQTCPEMRASEWQYLCAVHDPPKSCSAIDYCCHTLDWAANTLTSSKMFPSRLGLGSGSGGQAAGNDKVLVQQMKEITNIFRRVYRMYAHAWFQHREMFWKVEGKTGLYVFFKTVCDEYGMIQPENYTIPSEAEGFEVSDRRNEIEQGDPAPVPLLLKRDGNSPGHREEQPENHAVTGGETTRKHRHTKSDLGDSASIIQEEEEEEDTTEASLAATEADKEASDEQPRLTATVEGDGGAPLGSVSAIAEAHGQDDLPFPRVTRSDTMKPPGSRSLGADKTTSEEDNDADVTIIETEVAPDPIAQAGTMGEEVMKPVGIEAAEAAEIRPMDPKEAAAADGEESGKTVDD